MSLNAEAILVKPRFVNPHFLPTSTEPVSRKDAFFWDGEHDSSYDSQSQTTDLLLGQLNQWIQTSLELDSSLERENQSRRKRRKIVPDSPPTPVNLNEPLLFRLVSRSLPPQHVLLEANPPPPPVTREPDCEDNKAQAALRKKRARAAAVDFSWIVGESLKLNHPCPQKLLHTQASLPYPPPVMMIVQRDQPARKTRPPVPASQLMHHPYVNGASVFPIEPMKARNYFQINANSLSPDDPPVTIKRRKRKRGKMSVKDRPLPTFWRPNPACHGKCLGYAMGYPCSSGQDLDGSESYRRDTMRKGVYSHSLA